jgi:LPXTG-motif cell wall-anchored protein
MYQASYSRRLITIILMISSLALPSLAAASTATPNANALMPNGCSSPADCSNKVHNGDATIRNLFQAYHITAISINQAAPGVVTKSGLVIVNNKTVATHARSFGRTDLPGSTFIHGAWRRPTSVSFATSQLPAFVHMTNGRFDYAVIESCGNLVVATPVALPPTLTPPKTAPSVPAPVVNVVQIQSQTQSQVQTPAPTPVPAVQTQTQGQVQAQLQARPQVQAQAQTQTQPPAPTAAPAPSQPVAATTPLPQTGASATALAGLSTLLVVAAYYRRSRRGLRLALRRS